MSFSIALTLQVVTANLNYTSPLLCQNNYELAEVFVLRREQNDEISFQGSSGIFPCRVKIARRSDVDAWDRHGTAYPAFLFSTEVSIQATGPLVLLKKKSCNLACFVIARIIFYNGR